MSSTPIYDKLVEEMSDPLECSKCGSILSCFGACLDLEIADVWNKPNLALVPALQGEAEATPLADFPSSAT